ncbi:hypothetical protein E2C01_008716 [Portunus trituberculatus]|uniref:Uncharacterized protein n=1 Tax=Portunus trituberculatus TaxID=210409 RepID=A0A5B7D1I4_PORTR|nr:hypothetical protein [Portunus trituberculatus]
MTKRANLNCLEHKESTSAASLALACVCVLPWHHNSISVVLSTEIKKDNIKTAKPLCTNEDMMATTWNTPATNNTYTKMRLAAQRKRKAGREPKPALMYA